MSTVIKRHQAKGVNHLLMGNINDTKAKMLFYAMYFCFFVFEVDPVTCPAGARSVIIPFVLDTALSIPAPTHPPPKKKKKNPEERRRGRDGFVDVKVEGRGEYGGEGGVWRSSADAERSLPGFLPLPALRLFHLVVCHT